MSLDPAKLLIVAAVALIILGPEKLPGVLRQAGKYWSTFKSIRDTVQGEMTQVMTQVTSVGASVSESLVDPLSQMKGTYATVRTQVSESFLPQGSGASIQDPDDASDVREGSGSPMPRSSFLPPARWAAPMSSGSHEDHSWPIFMDAGKGAFVSGSPELN